jgi:hypothetical protein
VLVQSSFCCITTVNLLHKIESCGLFCLLTRGGFFLLTDRACMHDTRRCQILPRLCLVHVCMSGITITKRTRRIYCLLLLHQHYYVHNGQGPSVALDRVFPTCLLVIAGRVEADHVVMVAAAAVASYYLTTTTRWTWVVSRWTTQQQGSINDRELGFTIMFSSSNS